MTKHRKTKNVSAISPIYLVTGGSGASGEQVIETVLAQFPDVRVPIIRKTSVRRKKQIQEVISEAAEKEGTIVHTLVDAELRETLVSLGKKKNVETIDLMGDLLNRVAGMTGREPAGKPGLYRKLHREYFDRIASIEFAITHDDGQRIRDLSSADIILTGVSRCGKTPLSMYLAVLGWKAANVPLVPEVPPPKELFSVDRRRVIGLSIAFEHLAAHRHKRQERMGALASPAYSDRSVLTKELEYARKIFRKGGFHIVNVTDKPIESTADEIIEYFASGFRKKPPKKRYRDNIY